MNPDLEKKRHTLAHLLALAVRRDFPHALPTIGPAIETGFYYDFDFSAGTAPTDVDLKQIEKNMKKALSSWKAFSHREVTPDEAREVFKGNQYKTELINDLEKAGETITLYTVGEGHFEFTDLCRGGHSESPASDIDPDSFRLATLAGAYWRGDEKNPMLTRIYGLAFNTKDELDQHLAQVEEAKKRDHRKIGQEMGLFMFHETAPGMPYWLPKGLALYNELVNFWRKEHLHLGYQEISSPLVNKSDLWHTSGHWEHYHEDMFIANMGENEIYGIKPMNCPNAMIVFQSMQVSYRDLPLRLSDTDRLHRYERSGTLNGLLRVRSFQQDDSHNFISEDMIATEYEHIFSVCEKFYSIFNLQYSFRLGTRPKKFLGEQSTWDKAETALRGILDKSGKEYSIEDGDGAFYGPKVDIVMKDSLGRDWQMGTIQLDFQLPQRFNLFYTDKDGSKKTPVVVHRVIYGSLERFIGILIEHVAGKFPLWLSPEQVRVIPVSDVHNEYAKEVYEGLKAVGVRATLDTSNDSMGKKIRNAKTDRLPYFVVVGDKEIAEKTVTLESRNGESQQMSRNALGNHLLTEIETKSL